MRDDDAYEEVSTLGCRGVFVQLWKLTQFVYSSNLATFMGDPNFPQILMNATQGEKILRYQDLYRQYSSLRLSEDSDRPMAIGSLQSRVMETLGAKGGYGILDEEQGSSGRGLLRRSLLWCRAHATPAMTPITFLPRHAISNVPSWSWMKYTGSIDYISPPFGDVDWEDLTSPWSSDMKGEACLLAHARKYNVMDAIDQGDGEIIFDQTSESRDIKELIASTSCIVLGRRRGRESLKDSQRVHYFLLVKATEESDRDGRLIHRRVGAGYLPGKCIGSDQGHVSVH